MDLGMAAPRGGTVGWRTKIQRPFREGHRATVQVQHQVLTPSGEPKSTAAFVGDPPGMLKAASRVSPHKPPREAGGCQP